MGGEVALHLGGGRGGGLEPGRVAAEEADEAPGRADPDAQRLVDVEGELAGPLNRPQRVAWAGGEPGGLRLVEEHLDGGGEQPGALGERRGLAEVAVGAVGGARRPVGVAEEAEGRGALRGGEPMVGEQPLPDLDRLGGAAAREERLGEHGEQRRAGPLAGEVEGGPEVVHRGLQRAAAQRRAAGALQHRDRRRVADQVRPDGVLGRLGLEALGGEHRDGAGVEACAHRRRGVLVEGLAEEGMDELQGASVRGAHQPAARERLEGGVEVALVHPRHLGDRAGAEAHAEGARGPGEAHRRLGERREAREQQLVGDPGARGVRGLGQLLAAAQAAGHLLEEQAVPVAEGERLGEHRLALPAAPVDCEQLEGGVVAERPQPLHLRAAPADERAGDLAGAGWPRPQRAHHRHRAVADAAAEGGEQGE